MYDGRRPALEPDGRQRRLRRDRLITIGTVPLRAPAQCNDN
jgi:hypothetical protein